MKYTVEVTIDRPRQQVLALFDNPELMPKWQKGFVSLKHLSGEVGQAGAKAHDRSVSANHACDFLCYSRCT